MTGQTFRWGMAFAATGSLAAALLLSAARAPAPKVEASVVKRDPSAIGDVERELILNKIREGDLFFVKGDAAAARRAWQEARRLGEGVWPVHEGLGDSYARAKLYEEAMAEYRAAETLVPEKHAAVRRSLVAKRSAVLTLMARPLEAMKLLLELHQPELHGPRVLALAQVAEPDAAATLIEREADVYDPRWYGILSTLYTRFRRPGEAAEALAKYAMRVAPWDEATNRGAVEGLRQARKFDLAVEVCRAWVKAAPQSLDGYQLMGDVLLQAGRERDAWVAYSSMVDVRPGDAEVHRRLGELYLTRGRLDEALVQFGAAKQGGLDDTLRRRIGLAYQEQINRFKAEGKGDEARKLRVKLGELGLPEAGLFDLKVIMTWDANSDVDLDVIEPSGERVNHARNTSSAGARYYIDNTQGQGPETYTLAHAKPGTYKIGAHLHGNVKSVVKIVVILFEDSPRELRREETFTLTQGTDVPTFIQDLVIP